MADIKVIARTLGQAPDGQWKREGEEFEIDADLVSHKWMVRADGKPWPKPEGKRSAKVKAGDESRAAADAVAELKAMATSAMTRADKAEKEAEDLRKQLDDLTAPKK